VKKDVATRTDLASPSHSWDLSLLWLKNLEEGKNFYINMWNLFLGLVPTLAKKRGRG
jgi:hypothetical protein